MINDITIYDNGYASLLNKDGNFLVDTTYSTENNFKDIYNIDLISDSKDGIEYYSNNGHKSILGYSKLTNGNIMVITAEEDDIFKQIKNNML